MVEQQQEAKENIDKKKVFVFSAWITSLSNFVIYLMALKCEFLN